MVQANLEQEERLVQVKRVVKVVKGGRIFSFSALVVVGDMNGRVGFGKAKAKEVPLAMRKAGERAKKNMISVNLNDDTLHHAITSNYGASKVILLPASEGTGVIASEAARAVLELAGIKNVLTKTYGSRNPFNVVAATFKALSLLVLPEEVARRRGVDISL
jgi:small subunit ribosomal protein S5